MFYGRFEHNIDAKGRLTIPSSFREQTPGGVYITKGLDSNLMAYSKAVYETIAKSLNAISITDPRSRSMRREILGNTAELSFDSAGRILIPAYLRQIAHLDSEVIIVGVGDGFEIWSKELLFIEDAKNSDPEVNNGNWSAFDISGRGL